MNTEIILYMMQKSYANERVVCTLWTPSLANWLSKSKPALLYLSKSFAYQTILEMKIIFCLSSSPVCFNFTLLNFNQTHSGRQQHYRWLFECDLNECFTYYIYINYNIFILFSGKLTTEKHSGTHIKNFQYVRKPSQMITIFLTNLMAIYRWQ